MFYVYVLRSLKSSRRYIGNTNNLNRRLMEHNSGRTKSLKSKGPFKLIHFEQFETKIEAVKREIFLKSGIGREELNKMGL